MGMPEEQLLAVAARVSDGVSDETSANSDWDTAESPVGDAQEGTLHALKEIARVAEAYRALVRSDDHALASAKKAPLGRWGHLELMEKLGEGAAAEVFRVHDTRLDHDVALKLFKRTELTEAEKQAVLEEGRRHARVKHPNIATIHDADEHDGRIGISMEYIDGSTLHDVVAQQGPHGAGEAAHIGAELCRAVAAIHGQGLVHGDIKAQNVMREKGGRIVVMDFSTSRPLKGLPATGRTHTGGTPIYMAPELFEEAAPSPQSDVYALGVLLFYLATGDYPVKARSLGELRDAVLRDERQSLYDLRPDLPAGLSNVIHKAIARDAADRFQSVGALGGALSQTAEQPRSSDSGRARPVTPLPAFVRPLGALAGIVLLIGLLGFVSSMAFNVTLSRPASFAAESVTDWFIWGLRALIPPLVYMALAAIVFALLLGLWRALNMVGPLRRGVAKLRSHLARFSGRLHLNDPTILAQALFAIGVLALAAVIWGYIDLISAFMTPLNEAHSVEIAALRPDQIDSHVAYGRTLDLIILVLSVAWLKVFRAWRKERPQAGVMPLVATIAVIAAAVLLWVTPYRIVFQNEFEKIELDGQRGYILGEREGELLIYLPEAARNERRLVISDGDSRLHRLQVMENVFSP